MSKIEYREQLKYFNSLRTHFKKRLTEEYTVGKINWGDMDNWAYFSITTSTFKKEKLKFVLILNHNRLKFQIGLSGQNKAVRKNYWQILETSNWNKYPLVASIDDSLTIIDHVLIEDADFSQPEDLTNRIEKGVMSFISDFDRLVG